MISLIERPARLTTTGSLADRHTAERWEGAVRIAVGATVFRDSQQQLTTPGQVVELLARILGPVLPALAVLAIRNRVKR